MCLDCIYNGLEKIAFLRKLPRTVLVYRVVGTNSHHQYIPTIFSHRRPFKPGLNISDGPADLGYHSFLTLTGAKRFRSSWGNRIIKAKVPKRSIITCGLYNGLRAITSSQVIMPKYRKKRKRRKQKCA